ncbi:unnamed protein product [Vicia faba]|uniref:Uncharacterized protein n=1 Tax=Vicia faba TaxID=3906 RepID=A0AAV0ZUS5_VICFA|nr:unnamed protein product [Vicia faba]
MFFLSFLNVKILKRHEILWIMNTEMGVEYRRKGRLESREELEEHEAFVVKIEEDVIRVSISETLITTENLPAAPSSLPDTTLSCKRKGEEGLTGHSKLENKTTSRKG